MTKFSSTGVLVFANGDVLHGHGFGFKGRAVGEVCFNTSITGYQEILTDPSYAQQIITFTMPHIGNVGCNDADLESKIPLVSGMICRNAPTQPSNWRSEFDLESWLVKHKVVAISGVDTRALTKKIGQNGASAVVIAHNPDGNFDMPALKAQAAAWGDLSGKDLASTVSQPQATAWQQGTWQFPNGTIDKIGDKHIVAIDYGMKDNIKRCLVQCGAKVTVVPCTYSAQQILDLQPDGIFLSNGPGDPAATGVHAIPVIKALLDQNMPTFGICLGFQLLALALGAKTEKLQQGHRGANHPVLNTLTNKVEITSQNHGFHVPAASLPDDVTVTHISLFDKTLEGFAHKTKPFFAVQHHPEASPGPKDSDYLFQQFMEAVAA